MRVGLRALTGAGQLAVQRGYPALLPALLRRGLDPADGEALAHNLLFLYHALALEEPVERPLDLLERFSIGQIARLCREYDARRDELEALEITLWKEEDNELQAGSGAEPDGL